MPPWILPAILLAAFAGLVAFSNWKAGQPYDELRPKLIPWRIVMLFAVFCIILTLVYIANLLGIETGREHSPFGRF